MLCKYTGCHQVIEWAKPLELHSLQTGHLGSIIYSVIKHQQVVSVWVYNTLTRSPYRGVITRLIEALDELLPHLEQGTLFSEIFAHWFVNCKLPDTDIHLILLHHLSERSGFLQANYFQRTECVIDAKSPNNWLLRQRCVFSLTHRKLNLLFW